MGHTCRNRKRLISLTSSQTFFEIIRLARCEYSKLVSVSSRKCAEGGVRLFKGVCPYHHPLYIEDSITIRDIDIITHNCFKYIHLYLFISESKEIVKLRRQAHVVDNLRTKFFMKMKIFEFEEIILDISRRKLIFSLCEKLKIDIRVILKMKQRRVN